MGGRPPDPHSGHADKQPLLVSDDVLFNIKPSVEGGKPQPYCVWLPDFHAPGTHWYHSHKHGSTASQVANGLAGALIVPEVDGITFYGHKPQPRDQWLLAPGNRADMLVKFDPGEEGVYKVLKANLPRSGIPANTSQVLGYIAVQQSGSYNDPNPQDIDLPPWSEAPAYLQPIRSEEISSNDTAIDFQNPSPSTFMINDTKYDPEQEIIVPLGCTQEWTLKNSGIPTGPSGRTGGRMSMPHPFHIHVNPFQVSDTPGLRDPAKKALKLIDQNGPDEPSNWIWWDTIRIPPQQEGGPPGELKIWTRFWDYPGRFVIHCHILVHEDLGMMANVRVEDPQGIGAGPCQRLQEPVPPVSCPS